MQTDLPQTLDAWLTHITAQHPVEIDMGLHRVQAVFQRLQQRLNTDSDPNIAHHQPITITVAGTNGKGSTCAMLEAMLRIAGYKTGFYSSPHLLAFNERIRLNGQYATDAQLISAFSTVAQAAAEAPASAPAITLTYFEYATLAALWLFAQDKVDVQILEVGLGGRLDATNIVDADVAILTSVDLDHQHFLGNTRELIGFEKAHIFRAGRPAICGEAMPSTVIDYAAKIGAQLQLAGRDFRLQRMESQWQFFGINAARHSLPIPALRGPYQLKNASCALAALDALNTRLPVSQGHAKRGLLEVEWPGRMQILPGQPTIVLDVAHNPHAARALNDALGGMGFYENSYAVFSMLNDKDIGTVIDTLKHRFDRWFVAGLSGARGHTGKEITDILAAHGVVEQVSCLTSVEAALAAAQAAAAANDRIVVFGSFHTVGAALQVLLKA
jgi:dihydrofolate synthase / folylpolyglutamate synthase